MIFVVLRLFYIQRKMSNKLFIYAGFPLVLCCSGCAGCCWPRVAPKLAAGAVVVWANKLEVGAAVVVVAPNRLEVGAVAVGLAPNNEDPNMSILDWKKTLKIMWCNLNSDYWNAWKYLSTFTFPLDAKPVPSLFNSTTSRSAFFILVSQTEHLLIQNFLKHLLQCACPQALLTI